MSNTSQNIQVGTPLPMLLFLVFLVLKLTDSIDWSWWWVTSPLWIPMALALSIVACVAGVGLVGGLFTGLARILRR